MLVLDLFSGIGGFTLGLEAAGMTTVAFCEIDPWCRGILRKHWPDKKQFDDIRKLKGDDIGTADVVVGGYPCQPYSAAGRRKGFDDDRDLWPEMHRIINELRPTWVIGENVAGHVSLGLDRTIADLERSGYSSRAFVIPASAVGAPHRRDRVWIVANTSSPRSKARIPETGQWKKRDTEVSDDRGGGARWLEPDATESGGGAEPRLGGVADGLPDWSHEPCIDRLTRDHRNRANRLHALGNAVVPRIPYLIGRSIMQSHA